MAISIDLRDLTPDHLRRCREQVGECRYSAPCIIGTLFDASKLTELQDTHSIDVLVAKGVIKMPVHQVDLATQMQAAFDGNDWLMVEELAAQAMSAFGQDPKGLEAKPASAVPKGCAQ